ncbi:hypothetical protein [Kurthia senegalensis]|uniref:hypothetical protein n=1 Tax=Kurthia senegalensis TaxID=1033740 RepID=UPI000288AE2E|nr:hypothetical protein [Kurthia senegalensis]
MNQNKNGIPVQLNVKKLKQRASSETGKIHIEKKIEKLFEFRKNGSMSEGFKVASVITPYAEDGTHLIADGFKYVRTIDL